MKRINSIFKRIVLGVLCFIFIILIGLVINNRVITWKYSKLPTNETKLTNEELDQVNQIYSYLNYSNEELFPGFNSNTIDLIIFNDDYEFLLSNKEEKDQWELIERNPMIEKNIYRRASKNPQAFAVYIGDRWVGSMSTMNTFHKKMVNEIGWLFPPQFISIDDLEYKGTVIHEMVHALQGENNNSRIYKTKSLHSVCSKYYDNQTFNELIAKEGYYLEQAIKATDKETIIENANNFIHTRSKRRSECNMSVKEIENEVDFEWLEGLARYAEYKGSTGSKSLVRKNMDNIEQKVKMKNDDRYYTLGMAEALLLDKLQVDWKDNAFEKDFSLEGYIKNSLKLHLHK